MGERLRYTREERKRRAIMKRRVLIAGMAISIVIFLCIVGAIVSAVRGGKDDVQEEQTIVEDDETTSEEGLLLEEEVMEPISVTLSFVGDCTLGTDLDYGYGNTFMEVAEEQTSDYFFANVVDIFSMDDLTIVNLEGPLTDGTDDADKTFAFKGELSYVDILVEGDVEVVNLANNHSYDYGVEGYEDTLEVTAEAGIIAYGYENTQIVDVDGVKVGFVGMYELSDGIGIMDEMIELINQVEEEGADVIIVSFHWGIEKDYYPTSTQTELAYAAIDNGADLIIGHHPHVLQGIEEYNGKYIVYSLGNFCFGGNRNPDDKDTIIYQQTFTIDEDGLWVDDNINIIPCSVSSITSSNNFQPTPLEGDEKTRVAEKLAEISMTDITSYIAD